MIWNIRGLRNSESQQRLHAFVKEKHVKVLAILEPMIELDQRFMIRRLGFSRVISNLSGHIWAFFTADVRAECVFYHAQFLHIKVSAPFLPTEFFCSFVYASCDYIERRNLWASLLQVKPALGPWLVGGDFNVVRDASEFFARGPSSFRFQRMWLRHHGFLQTVRLNWNLPCSLIGMPRLFAKLKRHKNHLMWWNRDVFGNIFDKITEAESAVRSAETACEADPSDSNWTTLSDRNEDLARVIAMEADFWKQKAACNWLEDCERNTKLFHNMVKKKRVANKIFRIWDEGVCLMSPEMIQQSGASFFQHLLTGDPFVLDCPDFSGFPSVISDEENYGITATPSFEEVRATVFSISLDIVAGLDGFSSAFFQHCWEIVVQPPLAVMEKLERVFNAFLWGSRPLEKKWHWARWSRACLPVVEGGLGFHRLKDLVDSFSIKLWFRFRQGSSLWAKFLMRKYCLLAHPVCVSSRVFISPTWRRLLQIRPRAESGIRWRVGHGEVYFWDDCWFRDVPLSSQTEVRGDRGARVSHFLSEGTWDFDLLCSVVAPSIAEQIVLVPILSGESDSARWIHSSDGAFSVKSAWELIRFRAPISDINRPCWGSWLRPTMSFFLWRFWHQWLPVDEVLQRRGFALASRCQCCDMSETFTHVFIRSPVARSVWFFFGAVFGVRIPDTEDFRYHRTAIVRWLKPPSDCFKLNVDGSSRGNPGDSTVGGVVRDHSGRVLLSFSEFIGAGSTSRAELWAVWRILLICSDLSLFPLWIEVDSQISVQILRSRQCRWGLDHIVSRILVLLRGRMVHISHIYREGNSVADALAVRAHDLRQFTLEIALSPLVLFFGSFLLSGRCSLQASPCPPLYYFCALWLIVMVALDDLFLWSLWPGVSFMSGFIWFLLSFRDLVALVVLYWLHLLSELLSCLDF
ncbi:uncharacterized protein LOC142538510 [Primulina tabacum]|uniref:uncharacterized protein LOC142538510 n=1 Tax=Primulina tabacum TaxID=48773 RepID=UPI003F59C815